MSVTEGRNVRPEHVFKGESKTIEVTALDPAGVARDLTGGRVVMTVKETLGGVAIITKDSLAGPTQADIYSPTAGKARVFLVPADTSALTAKTYVYDVWVILASGARYVAVDPSPFRLEQPVSVIA